MLHGTVAGQRSRPRVGDVLRRQSERSPYGHREEKSRESHGQVASLRSPRLARWQEVSPVCATELSEGNHFDELGIN